MANVDADYGFEPMSNYSGYIREMECAVLAGYGIALFVGDPVKFGGTGDSQGRPSIIVSDAGDTNTMGVIIGFKASSPDSLTTQHSLASTADIAIVVPTLPFTVFRVNASNTTGARLNDIGLLFDHVAGTGNSKTGRSGYALDMGEDATSGATTANTWRLFGFDRRPDNEFSTTVTTDTTNVDLLVVCVETIWNYGINATVGEGT